jgi:type VI secretion system secreted protein Hcp
MAIYMKYGSINGPITTEGYSKWIELDSFHFGVGRHIASAQRTEESREASEPTLSEITVTKNMDVSSPKLFIEGVASDLKNKVEIKFTTTKVKTVTDYLSYELSDVGLSNYGVSSSAEGIPVETLTLNYTKIQMKFTSMGPGVSGSPETVGYDLTKMQTT